MPEPHFLLDPPFSAAFERSGAFAYPYAGLRDGSSLVHTGIDIPNSAGTPVLAVAGGEVVYAGNDAGVVFGPHSDFYGNLVVQRIAGTRDDAPVYVLYAHLSSLDVTMGRAVSPGDVIGRVGMTGVAIGPHLHLEVRQGGSSYAATRNPELWLRPLPGTGTLVGKVLDEAGKPVPKERLLVYRASRPDQVWRVVRTYVAGPEVHSDDVWRENFLLADVPAGDYLVIAGRVGALVTIPVKVVAGQAAFVEITLKSEQ